MLQCPEGIVVLVDDVVVDEAPVRGNVVVVDGVVVDEAPVEGEVVLVVLVDPVQAASPSRRHWRRTSFRQVGFFRCVVSTHAVVAGLQSRLHLTERHGSRGRCECDEE